MINIIYTTAENESPQYFYFEGRVYPYADKKIPITVNWNNRDVIFQYIVNKQYRIKVKVKESDFLELQDILYANNLYINYEDDNISVKVEKFNSNKFLNEFRDVEIIFSDKNTKYKNITPDYKDRIRIVSNYYDIYFTPIRQSKFERNEADNFEEIINDYTRLIIYYNVRLILNEEDYFNILDDLHENNTAILRLVILNKEFENYKITNNRKLSQDLYMMDLELIDSKDIKTIY